MARSHHHGSLASPLETVHAITGQAHVGQNVKLAELVGTYLESNQRPNAKGGGAFQINLAAHPDITEAQAENPVRATRYMRAAYEAAVRTVGSAAFKANPEQAAERAAYLAEKPQSDYYASQGPGRVHEAFLAATGDLHAPSVPSTPGGAGQAPIVYSGKVTSASKQAARKLWQAGIRGRTLVISLGIIGAMTKGTYNPRTVDNFVSSFKANHGHLRETLGASVYENGHYLKYIGTALLSLKAVGHPTRFTIESHDPGVKGSGGPSGLEQVATGTQGVIDSVGGALKWFSSADHLIRVGFIVLGFILIIVGLAKLSGATIPTPKA